jgi:cytochrome c oxidase subunit IV
MSTIVEPSPDSFEGHPESEAHIPGAHQPASLYIKVAVILAVFTALETSTYYFNYGSFAVPLLLVLMVIKFATVVAYFMHLKFDNRLFTWLFYTGVFLAIGVYAAALATFEFFMRS